MPVRMAREGESRALTALALASKAYWGYDEEFMALVHDELFVSEEAVATGLVFVETSDGQDAPRGFYALADPEGGSIGLDMMFVTPEHVGHGIGARLLEHARGVALTGLVRAPHRVRSLGSGLLPASRGHAARHEAVVDLWSRPPVPRASGLGRGGASRR